MSTYAVVNPATGETIKEYPEISDDELRAAIDRCDQASRSFPSSTSVADRAALVRKVGELHSERRQELAEIIVREMGKPIEQALMEVDFAGMIYGFYADNAEDLMADEPIELLDGEGTAVIRRSPFGVLLGIMPWNFPYYQVARFAGPNLVIGNTILLKHAPQCPESAEAMQKMFDDAGFPEGAYENIYATNEQIEWVIADPRVHGVSVTGSERAGAAVAAIAGQQPEEGRARAWRLGPIHPARHRRSRRSGDGGGRSAARQHRPVLQRRQAVHRRRRALRRLPREVQGAVRRRRSRAIPTAEDTAVGPLSSQTAADRLEDQVKRAVENGAEVVVGGKRDGNFFEPTILTGIKPGDEASQEEFFGPVAQVYKVASEEEAVELANQTPFGLGSYVMTTDKEQAERVADRIEAGMVYVNLVGADSPGAAVRRLQALRLRARARPLRRRRVRQQEADPQRLAERAHLILSGSARVTS